MQGKIKTLDNKFSDIQKNFTDKFQGESFMKYGVLSAMLFSSSISKTFNIDINPQMARRFGYNGMLKMLLG